MGKLMVKTVVNGCDRTEIHERLLQQVDFESDSMQHDNDTDVLTHGDINNWKHINDPPNLYYLKVILVLQ
jgi:hypothetical protein